MASGLIVHFIRHEKTKANLERKYIGWTDESILFNGTINPLPIEASIIYGSDLKRCEQTAKLYFPKATYIPFSEFRELSFGDFEMKTYEELKNNALYRQWVENPLEVVPPNGESFQHFKQRVFHCFENIVNASGEYVFILHGGVIRVLLEKFGSEQKFQEITVSHRTVYTLHWDCFTQMKGGDRCKQLSVVPITVNENL